MFSPTLLLLAASLLVPQTINAMNITVTSPTAFQAASPNTVVSNVLTLNKKAPYSGYNPRSAVYQLGLIPTGASTALISLLIGEEFATKIKLGTRIFDVIVDTGSSDTWVVGDKFQCADVSNSAPVPESSCAFGPTYSTDHTFSKIPNVNFNITYGSGEFLSGIFGYEEVTLANIAVKQQIAVVNFAAWQGDGTTSGLIGLAYPALTSEYAGTNPHNDKTQIIYNSIFTTMYTERQIKPLFSLAILRNISGPSGYLALGGVPPINFVQEFTSTPILITTIEGYPKKYSFYTIEASVSLNGKVLAGSNIKYIVDSGTTLNYYPTPIAKAINAAFDPPAYYVADEGAYYVSCKAKAPTMGINIGGTTFNINPLDMILYVGKDSHGNNLCISGVDDGGSNINEDVFILGNTFQKNVVIVFDIGAVEMRFAPYEKYPSNDPY